MSRNYAAVHLGDGTVSVLVVSDDAAAQYVFRPSVSMHEGALEVLETSSHSGIGTEQGVYDVTGSGESVHRMVDAFYPTRFVDDADVLVGSTLVRTETILREILTEVLRRAGVSQGVDILEIACPATWGSVRARVVRSAAMPLAREVSIADAAVATVQSVGERAPSSAIVVELAELESVVSALSSVGDGTYARIGRWDSLGLLDLATGDDARRSILDRITASSPTHGSSHVTDVFVLDTSGLGDTGVLAEGSFRVHRTTGADVVRSMAARAGLSIEGSDRGWASQRAHPTSDPWHLPVDEFSSPGAAPMPVRAASWLGDAETVSSSGQQRPVGKMLAGVGVLVVLAAALVAVFVAGGSDGSRASTGVSVSTSSSRTPSGPVPTTAGAGGGTQSAPEDTALTTFDHGRVTVRLPATWTQRIEPDRTVLVPPDLPDRRILLTTTALRPGATFDEVADELTESIERRSADGGFGDLNRATDVGGRVVLSYTEAPDAGSTVFWQILVQDDLQISVGCQSAIGQSALLEDECAQVVSTVTVSR